MDLNHLLIFKKVAESGSFTATAAQLGLPKSSVSQKVGQLEQELGVRLLQRTTRRVSLTEIGEKVYEGALRIAAEADEITAVISDLGETPAGHLRVTAPHDFGTFLIERVLRPFLQAHPAITVDVDLSNRFVDLVNDRIDVALRASSAPLKESSLVARPLLTARLRLYASPSWVKAHRHPKTAADLAGADAAIFAPGLKHTASTLTLRAKRGEGASIEIPVRPVVRTNDFVGTKRAALSGLGIALLPEISVLGELERGELTPLLPDWEGDSAQCYVVYPSRKHVPAKTRAFVQFLTDWVSREKLRGKP